MTQQQASAGQPAIGGGIGLRKLADRLALARYNRVGAMIPFMYLAIGINSLATTLASDGNISPVYQYVLPGILFVFSLYRYVVWKRRDKQAITPDYARKRLKSTLIFAVVLSFLGGMWALSAFLDVDDNYRTLPVIFTLISSIAASICMATVPRAPQVIIVLALGPITVAMLLTGDNSLHAIAISIMLLTVMVMHQGSHYARELESALRLRMELEREAWFDSLTGLANRSCLASTFEDARQDADPQDRFTLLIADLDGFKAANDTYGHIAGDGVLVEMADRLRNLFTDASIIARFGGDEFVLLFTGPARSDWEERLKAADKVMAMPVADGMHTIPISASFGIAETGAHEAHLDRLLIEADTLLYDRKAKRRPIRRRA